jgi:hypothetical protein
MRWRSIVCSLLVAAGCGTTGGGNGGGPDPMTGEVLKVTYIRFNQDQRTRRWVPEYRVMLSTSWHAKYGENSNEPYRKLFPSRSSRAPFLGQVPDEKMKILLAEFKRKGIDKLKWVKPEDVDLVALSRVERDPELAQVTRIITVGSDTEQRSYLLTSVVPFSQERKIYDDCEREVIKMMVQYTAQVTTESSPFVPKD